MNDNNRHIRHLRYLISRSGPFAELRSLMEQELSAAEDMINNYESELRSEISDLRAIVRTLDPNNEILEDLVEG